MYYNKLTSFEVGSSKSSGVEGSEIIHSSQVRVEKDRLTEYTARDQTAGQDNESCLSLGSRLELLYREVSLEKPSLSSHHANKGLKHGGSGWLTFQARLLSHLEVNAEWLVCKMASTFPPIDRQC